MTGFHGLPDDRIRPYRNPVVSLEQRTAQTFGAGTNWSLILFDTLGVVDEPSCVSLSGDPYTIYVPAWAKRARARAQIGWDETGTAVTARYMSITLYSNGAFSDAAISIRAWLGGGVVTSAISPWLNVSGGDYFRLIANGSNSGVKTAGTQEQYGGPAFLEVEFAPW